MGTLRDCDRVPALLKLDVVWRKDVVSAVNVKDSGSSFNTCTGLEN